VETSQEWNSLDPEEVLARNALELNHDKFWCILCSRPRFKNYCPASSHSPNAHKVIPRRQLSMETQVELYCKRGKFRGDR
jgi:hypothetical protein